jgi:maltose O-acetyltransferase
MTEREKMLAGLDYNSRDAELLSLYSFSKKMMKRYNLLEADEVPLKTEILSQWLGAIGEGVWIEQPFYGEFGKHIRIGSGTFINMNCVFLDNNIISIGKNGLIAPSVQIYTANHPIIAGQRIHNGRYITSSQPVTIGDDCWIGGGAIIFPGVTVGDRVTIGAGSVVTKDIPSDVLAVGNPCRIIKNLS